LCGGITVDGGKIGARRARQDDIDHPRSVRSGASL
jgi:hypothetical protein